MGQIGKVQEPTFEPMKPVSTGNTGTGNNNTHLSPTYSNPGYQNPQPNSQNGYAPGTKQHTNQIQVQYSQIKDKQLFEYQQLLREIKQDEKSRVKSKAIKVPPMFRLADHQSSYYTAHANFYVNAFEIIQKMLSGERNVSVKEAIWEIESIWPEPLLTRREYEQKINSYVAQVRAILETENIENSNLAIHYAIQELYRENIQYDFNDFWAEHDLRNMFVTKLLRTGKGQCRSLPLLYMILCEELGAEAFLSFSPGHSFIQAKDGNGSFYYFETTNGRIMSRDWLMRSNLVKAEAIKNRIYLYPLDSKTVVAELLVDLASNYIDEFGYDEFVLDCARLCISHSPYSVRARMIHNNFAVALCANEAYRHGNPPIQEYDKYPKLQSLVIEMDRLDAELLHLGVENISAEQYDKWIRSGQTSPNQ